MRNRAHWILLIGLYSGIATANSQRHPRCQVLIGELAVGDVIKLTNEQIEANNIDTHRYALVHEISKDTMVRVRPVSLRELKRATSKAPLRLAPLDRSDNKLLRRRGEEWFEKYAEGEVTVRWPLTSEKLNFSLMLEHFRAGELVRQPNGDFLVMVASGTQLPLSPVRQWTTKPNWAEYRYARLTPDGVLQLFRKKRFDFNELKLSELPALQSMGNALTSYIIRPSLSRYDSFKRWHQNFEAGDLFRYDGTTYLVVGAYTDEYYDMGGPPTPVHALEALALSPEELRDLESIKERQTIELPPRQPTAIYQNGGHYAKGDIAGKEVDPGRIEFVRGYELDVTVDGARIAEIIAKAPPVPKENRVPVNYGYGFKKIKPPKR